MNTALALRPVLVEESAPSGLNRDLSRRELASIRRRVEAASARPAPGGSDLLAYDLWREEIHVGPRTVRVYDCTGMPSVALKRSRA